MEAIIITVGDEILIGQVVDTNSAWIAEQLNLQGIRLREIHSVSDTREAIIAALNRAFQHTNLILMTGGLGPTKDDITKKAIADYYETGMAFHDPTFERIQKLFERWGRTMTDAHQMQCYMPENAQLLANRMGTAPGMWFEREGKVLISMPGVPYEMKAIMTDEALPRLRKRFAGQPIAHRTILTVGEGESRLAARIQTFEEQLPENISIAYLPNLGQVRIRLTATGPDQSELERLLDKKVEEIHQYLSEFIFGYEKETLPEIIGRRLNANDLTIATAESCTGGYLAHLITSVAGASEYFKGSVIAYANEIKMHQLGVHADTLRQYGAVSEATVLEMAAGVRTAMRTDIGLATSGIAGPDGGTPEKPVGTIWLAIDGPQGARAMKLQLGKDRLKNIEYTASQALNLVRQQLDQLQEVSKI